MLILFLCERNSYVNSLLDGFWWILVYEDDIGDLDDFYDFLFGLDYYY